MPYSSNPLLAPVFQSPVGDGRDQRPPVVSIKRAEDSMGSGIRLHHNQAREGFILQPEAEGLGVAPVEVQSAPLASGGSVARHARLTEGDVFLPITLVSPVPSALPGMFDALVDVARPGQRGEDGLPLQFEVVVYDPYGQETRARRLIFESGLGDPVRVNHHVWRTSITGRFVDPYWYGSVRELRRTLGSVDKKFITASKGKLLVSYGWEGAPHNSPSVKVVDGEVVARNLISNPSFEENLNGWSHYQGSEFFRTNSSRDDMWGGVGGEYRLQVAVGSGPQNRVQYDLHPDEVSGRWVAVRALVATGESGERVELQVESIGPDGTTLETLQLTDDARYYDGALLSGATLIPEHASRVRVFIRFRGGTDGRGWVDQVHASVGDTEQDALDQIAEYVDGSFPDDYETTLNDPTSYEWVGEPHSSASVKKVGGNVVARNLSSNPSFEVTAAGWSSTNGTIVRTSSHPDMWGGKRSGQHIAEVASTGSSALSTVMEQDYAAVSAGSWVALGVLVAAEESMNVRIGLNFNVGGTPATGYEPAAPDEGHRMVFAAQVPAGASGVRAQIRGYSGSGAAMIPAGDRLWWDSVIMVEADSEQEALRQVATYFDGDSPDEPGALVYDGPGAYEFPFFPVRIGGSVVQGEYELTVEGDAPAYWSGVITPPGEDLLIQNAQGERIFVKGRVDEPILIQTRPQEQDITLADGTPIWDRIDPGDDDFFPLHPGRNTVHVSMVGATQQSEILIRYREAFFHSLGGGS